MSLIRVSARGAAAPIWTLADVAARHRLVRAVYGYGVRTVGRRFTRFAFGSALALAASELTLLVCLAAHAWPTVSAAAGWFAGALVSYILSRWAWERRGRPHLLKETLPFWVIAGCTIVVLSVATSMAHHLALVLGLAPAARLVFDGAAYLAANTLTFLARFVILNYVLFATSSRGKASSVGGPAGMDGAVQRAGDYPSAGSARTVSPGTCAAGPAEPRGDSCSSRESAEGVPAAASAR